jgi:CRP/FNR family transcriptional regulator, nitrogen fixation regulation protein
MPAQPAAAWSPSRSAPANLAEDLKLIGAAKAFGRDQAVFGEGDSADYVYRVVSGAVRSFRMLADGRRQIVAFHLPGDVFGVELGPQRRLAAEALGETTLIVARRSAVGNDGAQNQALWRHAMAELGRSQDHALTLGRRSASERVASFLVDLAARTGAVDAVELPMSRQDMADFLGLTIETVSRTITQLQSHGAIAVSGCRRIRFASPSALAHLCE